MFFRCRDLFGLLSLWWFVLCAVRGFKITKEGFVLLQFAPAAGVRQYDWSRKQVFYTWLSLIIKCGYVCFILKILELWIYSDFLGQYWTGIIEWMSGWQMIFCYNPILSFAFLTMIDYMLLQKCLKTLLLIKKQWFNLWIVPLYTPLISIRLPFDKSCR